MFEVRRDSESALFLGVDGAHIGHGLSSIIFSYIHVGERQGIIHYLKM